MTLFHAGDFESHAGAILPFKVDCDFLSPEDWAWAADFITERVDFSYVQGIPTGGMELETALRPYAYSSSKGASILIVDDVLTTGTSMEEAKATWSVPVVGWVLFARGPLPDWVQAIWRLHEN